jgi:hypothetical protein
LLSRSDTHVSSVSAIGSLCLEVIDKHCSFNFRRTAPVTPTIKTAIGSKHSRHGLHNRDVTNTFLVLISTQWQEANWRLQLILSPGTSLFPTAQMFSRKNGLNRDLEGKSVPNLNLSTSTLSSQTLRDSQESSNSAMRSIRACMSYQMLMKIRIISLLTSTCVSLPKDKAPELFHWQYEPKSGSELESTDLPLRRSPRMLIRGKAFFYFLGIFSGETYGAPPLIFALRAIFVIFEAVFILSALIASSLIKSPSNPEISQWKSCNYPTLTFWLLSWIFLSFLFMYDWRQWIKQKSVIVNHYIIRLRFDFPQACQ